MSCALAIAVASSAQSARKHAKISPSLMVKPMSQKEKQQRELGNTVAPSVNVPFVKKQNTLNPSPLTVPAVDIVDIGTAGNALGLYSNPRTYLWADPNINAVTLSHRATTPSSGYIQYDYSNGGGVNGTWKINQGPAYATVGTPPSDHPLARYPQGVIFNPQGNTVADSAYFAFYAPVRDTTNPGALSSDWGGVAYGVYQISGKMTRRQHIHRSDATYKHVIPDAFHVSQKGEMFSAEGSQDMSIGDNGEYTGNMIVSKGTFNTSNHDITNVYSTFSAPVIKDNSGYDVIADQKIAFAPDGMTGYISFLGCNDFQFLGDSAYYPILYKTVDGGQTWTGPINVNINDTINMQISKWYNDTLGYYFTTGFQHDLVVDKDGNPHLFTIITPSSGAWSIYPSLGYMADLYMENGVWKVFKVSNVQSYRGVFDTGTNALTEWNRGQISINYAGTRVFYTWFDTDTLTYQGLGNTYPNMFSSVRDIATNDAFGPYNFTLNSLGEASVTFGAVSYYVFEPSPNVYEIPCAYQLLNNNSTTVPVQFEYIQNATIDCTTLGVKKDNGSKSNAFAVTQNNPNPFHDITSFNVSLTKSSNVSVSVYNTIGQKMFEKSSGSLPAGRHTLTLDASKLSAGIYFYSVKAGDQVVTKKMIVE